MDRQTIEKIEGLAVAASKAELVYQSLSKKVYLKDGELIEFDIGTQKNCSFTNLDSFWRNHADVGGRVFALINSTNCQLRTDEDDIFSCPLTRAYKYLADPQWLNQKEMIRLLKYEFENVPPATIQALRQYKASATTETEAVEERVTSTLGKRTTLQVRGISENDLSFVAEVRVCSACESMGIELDVEIDVEKNLFRLAFQQHRFHSLVEEQLLGLNVPKIEDFFLGNFTTVQI